MQAIAVLLFLAGAACFYLAAPNQVLRTRGANDTSIRPRLTGWSGLALTLTGTWAMSVPEGWPVAIASTLVALTCCLSAWPFIGVWMQRRRGAVLNAPAEESTR